MGILLGYTVEIMWRYSENTVEIQWSNSGGTVEILWRYYKYIRLRVII